MGRHSSRKRRRAGAASRATATAPIGLRTISGGGLAWTVEARDERELAAITRTVERWAEVPGGPSAEVLKSNRVRTVLRVDPESVEGRDAGKGRAGGEPSPGKWILKQYRHGDWMDRLRYRFVPSRARNEWSVLRRLRELGFPAPRPLCFGERRVGGSPVEGGLLMEEVPGAVSVLEALRAAQAGREPGDPSPDLPPAAARLLERTGELVRSLHDRGLDQPDLHPSNLLLSGGAAGDGRIHVIDLHSARIRGGLSRRRRLLGLSKLVHSLGGVTPAAGIRCLLMAYLGSAGEGRLRRLIRSLEAKASRIEKRRIRSRAGRCIKTSTTFEVLRERPPKGSAGVSARVYRRREVPTEHLQYLFTEPMACVAIKVGPDGWVGHSGIDGRKYLVKRRRYSLLEGLAGLLVPHRLRRAYLAGFALEVRGVPTPRVLILREERRLGLVWSAWLVTDLVLDGISLERHLFDEHFGKPPPRGEEARRKRRLFRRVGELIRRVHDQGIYTQDLSPQNIIVSPSKLCEGSPPGAAPPVLLADLDSVHLWRRLGSARRIRNLVQAGNMPEGHVSLSDRLRALYAYARGEPGFLDPAFLRALREGLLREAERTLERMVRAEAER